jgi:hypothetical protein
MGVRPRGFEPHWKHYFLLFFAFSFFIILFQFFKMSDFDGMVSRIQELVGKNAADRNRIGEYLVSNNFNMEITVQQLLIEAEGPISQFSRYILSQN